MNSNAKMLLGAIRWADLESAHGTADDVPNRVMELAKATTRDEAGEAYWLLDNYVVLQGTVFSSALHLVPVLLAMLGGSLSDAARLSILDLLFEIQSGDSSESTATEYEVLTLDCTRAVTEGLWFYWSSLLSNEPARRRTSIDLIGRLDPNGNRRALAIESGLRDSNPAVRKAAEWWLNKHESTGSSDV